MRRPLIVRHSREFGSGHGQWDVPNPNLPAGAGGRCGVHRGCGGHGTDDYRRINLSRSISRGWGLGQSVTVQGMWRCEQVACGRRGSDLGWLRVASRVAHDAVAATHVKDAGATAVGSLWMLQTNLHKCGVAAVRSAPCHGRPPDEQSGGVEPFWLGVE